MGLDKHTRKKQQKQKEHSLETAKNSIELVEFS